MSSLSFDPVAHMYDATRGYPDEAVARDIAKSIATAASATAATKFLEVGVGTGRIAFPLASAGHNYTGVDISEKMVTLLEEKLVQANWQKQEQHWGTLADEDTALAPSVRRFVQSEPRASMRLVLADITKLPFYDDSFDAVVAVHVFHLVDGWQQAVDEVLRVLHPGGVFLHCRDEHIGSREGSIRGTWAKIVAELGGSTRRPGAEKREEVTAYLHKRGLQPEEIRATEWQQLITPRQTMEGITQRLWSGTWEIPDAIFAESVKRLQHWVDQNFAGRMDIPVPIQRQFVISRFRV